MNCKLYLYLILYKYVFSFVGLEVQNRKVSESLQESDLVSQAEMRNLPTEIFRLDSLFQEFGHLRRFAGKESSPYLK